jgi:hypothetical protein
MSRRWIRLDTTWSSSEWLAELEPVTRFIWVELLCYVKAHGTKGVCRRSVGPLAGVTGVTRDIVTCLENAAIKADALRIEGGSWIVTNWAKYQDDMTAAERKRAQRQRQKEDNENEMSQMSRVTSVTSQQVTVVTPTETETETETFFQNARNGSKKPTKPTAIPPGWKPTQQHIQMAADRRLDVEREAEKFRWHAEAHSRQLVSWNAGFSQWLLKAEELAPEKPKTEQPMYKKASEVLW